MLIMKPMVKEENLEKKDDLNSYVINCINEDISIEEKLFKDSKLIDIDEDDLEFKKCIFDNCVISGNLNKSYFVDVIFKDCDLSNVDFTDSNFTRVSFYNSKAIGTNFISCIFREVSILESNFKYSNFAASTLKSTEFTNTSLDSTSLKELTTKNIEFNNCQMYNVNLVDTKLVGIDFRSSNLVAPIVRMENLKGAIVNSYQALEFSKLLGIIIKE